jgi:hypothetical protein
MFKLRGYALKITTDGIGSARFARFLYRGAKSVPLYHVTQITRRNRPISAASIQDWRDCGKQDPIRGFGDQHTGIRHVDSYHRRARPGNGSRDCRIPDVPCKDPGSTGEHEVGREFGRTLAARCAVPGSGAFESRIVNVSQERPRNKDVWRLVGSPGGEYISIQCPA